VKPRTLRRLALMAEAASLKMRDDVARHNTVLGQIEYQKRVLADYRARLKESWRHGGEISVGAALRAEVFVAASVEAAAKIEAEAERTRAMLDEALRVLAQNQQKRRGLETARAKALADELREIEKRLELAVSWRRKDEGDAG